MLREPTDEGCTSRNPARARFALAFGAALTTLLRSPAARQPSMKINTRSSSAKHAKKTGYRTRQKTKGGRKVNRRQRARHGSF